MIEVEKKFQPTDEEKIKLIEGADLVMQKKVQDDYFDTPTFDFAKKNMWLRNRDGEWELKVYMPSSVLGEEVANEIINEREILETLGFSSFDSFKDFQKEKLVLLGKIITDRTKYKKGEFILDFDETDFGLKKLDIELQIKNLEEAPLANQKILDLARDFGLTEVFLKLKPILYLEKMKPEIYNAIYPRIEKNNELNKLK